MGIYDDLEKAPKKNLPIFYLLDTSGSMSGEPIGILNRAMIETIEALKQVARNNSDANLQIAVLEFNTNFKWMQPNGLEDAEDFFWTDLQAGGLTDIGQALKELNQKMSRNEFLNDALGNLMPVVIIMTDGGATSSYIEELEKIKKNKWFKNASKIGFAVGDDADAGMIAEIVGNPEAVIKTEDMDLFAKLIKLASVTASKVGSVSRTTADTDIAETVVKEIKQGQRGPEEIQKNKHDELNLDDIEPVDIDWDDEEFD